MRSSLFLLVTSWCVAWGGGTGDGRAAEGNNTKPNILVITTDQQFADVMSCAGSDWVKTPAMDAIAKRGVRLPTAYVN